MTICIECGQPIYRLNREFKKVEYKKSSKAKDATCPRCVLKRLTTRKYKITDEGKQRSLSLGIGELLEELNTELIGRSD